MALELEIYIEGQRLELFKDETIRIKSTVQDINDISKVFSDFSQAFTVPASKNNNRIFKHYYNADLTNGFDARTKKDAVLYLNGARFRKGKIRLLKAGITNGLVENYQINFEGDVVKIKDILGDYKLKDLDFSQYNHNYDSDTIKTGLTDSLFSGNIIYPLISPVRRFLYDSSNSVVNDEFTVNIRYNASDATNSIRYNELKPAIKHSAIMDKIQETYELDFVGDFFSREEYTNAYMWLNKDEGLMQSSAINTNTLIDWTSGNDTYLDFGTDTITYNFVGYFEHWVFTIYITPDAGFENIPYNLVATRDGEEVMRHDNLTGAFATSYLDLEFNSGVHELKFYIESNQRLEFSAQGKFYDTSESQFDVPFSFAENNAIDAIVDITAQMPDMKVIDFITAYLKMHNIALTGNEDGSINWEILPEWYNSGKVYNITQYVDSEKSTISRGKLYNEFKFNYEKPETLLALLFQSNNGVAYGDLEQKLFDANGELLDGSSLEIKLPFSNMIYEKIEDLAGAEFTQLQYGYHVDKEFKPVVGKPLIFYNTLLGSPAMGFLNDDQQLELLNTNANVPSQLVRAFDSASSCLNFGAEISPFDGTTMLNCLYKINYSDYVSDMFNNQRRIYNFKAVLPLFTLTNLKLNDRLIIGNRRYIINSLSPNLTTGETNLELLNDIYSAGDIITDEFAVTPLNINANRSGDTVQMQLFTKTSTSIKRVNEGDGFFTTILTSSPQSDIVTVKVQVDAHTGETERRQGIEFDNGNGKIKVIIRQDGINDILFSNDVVTWDNTNITF